MSGDDIGVHISGHRCPYCHDDVVAEDPQGRHHCHACGALHHESCLREAGSVCAGCTTENILSDELVLEGSEPLEDGSGSKRSSPAKQEAKEKSQHKPGHCRICRSYMVVSVDCVRCSIPFHESCLSRHKCVPRKPIPATPQERQNEKRYLTTKCESKEKKLGALRAKLDKSKSLFKMTIIWALFMIGWMLTWKSSWARLMPLFMLSMVGAIYNAVRGYKSHRAIRSAEESIDFYQDKLHSWEEEEAICT